MGADLSVWVSEWAMTVLRFERPEDRRIMDDHITHHATQQRVPLRLIREAYEHALSVTKTSAPTFATALRNCRSSALVNEARATLHPIWDAVRAYLDTHAPPSDG